MNPPEVALGLEKAHNVGRTLAPDTEQVVYIPALPYSLHSPRQVTLSLCISCSSDVKHKCYHLAAMRTRESCESTK